VATIGEALWDCFENGERIGGAPLNVAWHAAQLGLRSAIVSAVGQDARGDRLRAWIDGAATGGLESSTVQVAEGLPTGMVNVHLADGQPSYEIATPAAWDAIEWNSQIEDLCGRAGAIVFGTLAQRHPATRATLRRFVASARPSAWKLFDVNLRQSYWDRETLEWGLRHATILKLNEAEFERIVQEFELVDDEDIALEEIGREFGIPWIALTRGCRGCRLVRMEGWLNVEARPEPVRVNDAVGAGDAFAAALIAGFLLHRPVEKIASHANEVGGYVATQMGASPVLPGHLRLGVVHK
jgi:fructokinase